MFVRVRALDLLNPAGLRMVIACVLTAGGLASFVVGWGGGEPGSTPNRSEVNTTAQANVSKAIFVSAFFSMLHRPLTSDDALPSLRHSPRGPVAATGGRLGPLSDTESAHAARRLSSAVPAWLVPGSDERLCLLYTVKALTRGPGGRPLPPAIVQRCTTLAAATAGRLIVTQSLSPSSRARSGSVLILGVVPDGVTRVSVISGNGHKIVDLVRLNSYSGIVVDPTEVKFSDRMGNGPISRQVPIAGFGRREAKPAR
jgi:hypothetical protein